MPALPICLLSSPFLILNTPSLVSDPMCLNGMDVHWYVPNLKTCLYNSFRSKIPNSASTSSPSPSTSVKPHSNFVYTKVHNQVRHTKNSWMRRHTQTTTEHISLSFAHVHSLVLFPPLSISFNKPLLYYLLHTLSHTPLTCLYSISFTHSLYLLYYSFFHLSLSAATIFTFSLVSQRDRQTYESILLLSLRNPVCRKGTLSCERVRKIFHVLRSQKRFFVGIEQ